MQLEISSAVGELTKSKFDRRLESWKDANETLELELESVFIFEEADGWRGRRLATAAKVVLLLLLKVRGASSLLVSLRIDSYASKVKISKLFQFHTVPARRKTKGNIISTLHPQIFLEKSALKPDFEAPFIPPLIPPLLQPSPAWKSPYLQKKIRPRRYEEPLQWNFISCECSVNLKCLKSCGATQVFRAPITFSRPLAASMIDVLPRPLRAAALDDTKATKAEVALGKSVRSYFSSYQSSSSLDPSWSRDKVGRMIELRLDPWTLWEEKGVKP